MTQEELMEYEILKAKVHKWNVRAKRNKAERKQLNKQKKMLLKEINEVEKKYDRQRKTGED